MTRQHLIEQLKRQVYGGFPTDDSTLTDNLINQWITQGVGIAAKKNYTDNYQIEGIGFVNNSFYTTFKSLAIVEDEQFLYKFVLPQLPLGIGATDGISRVLFKDSDGNVSLPGVVLNENQVGIVRQMRNIPNKILCYPEGGFCYAITPIVLSVYTAMVTMVSGGDSTNLSSTLNIPDDYIPTITTYVFQQLSIERMMPVDASNNGTDQVKVA